MVLRSLFKCLELHDVSICFDRDSVNFVHLEMVSRQGLLRCCQCFFFIVAMVFFSIVIVLMLLLLVLMMIILLLVMPLSQLLSLPLLLLLLSLLVLLLLLILLLLLPQFRNYFYGMVDRDSGCKIKHAASSYAHVQYQTRS